MLNIDKTTAAYLEAALWADLPECGKGLTLKDFTRETRERARAVCERFIRENEADLQDHRESIGWPFEELVGHDLWLSRQGHGSGFWDGPEIYGEDAANRLTRAADKLGEAFVFELEDGALCIEEEKGSNS